ncbi:MAG: hypothetical protein ABJB74_09845 [Gemmatimonas sp.]
MDQQSQPVDCANAQDQFSQAGANDITIRYSRSERVQQVVQVYSDSRAHRGADTNQQVSS